MATGCQTSQQLIKLASHMCNSFILIKHESKETQGEEIKRLTPTWPGWGVNNG